MIRVAQLVACRADNPKVPTRITIPNRISQIPTEIALCFCPGHDEKLFSGPKILIVGRVTSIHRVVRLRPSKQRTHNKAVFILQLCNYCHPYQDGFSLAIALYLLLSTVLSMSATILRPSPAGLSYSCLPQLPIPFRSPLAQTLFSC